MQNVCILLVLITFLLRFQKLKTHKYFTGICSFIKKLYRKLFYRIWTYSHTNTVLPTDSNSVGVLLTWWKDYSIST